MSAGGVVRKIQRNDGSMHNGLPSSESMKRNDYCCGIHGAARERKGIKRGTSSARRRLDKAVIQDEVNGN